MIPTLDAFFFGSECNADQMNSQRRCKVCAAHAGRLHAFFFVRGACRISGNFANFSRDFCAKVASSRRWARALSCITTHDDSEKKCNEVLHSVQPRWPSPRNFCARDALKFYRKFCNFSRELGARESSETDPAKVCVFGENNSSYQLFCRFQKEERNEK